MALISWSDTLAVNIKEIDDQHKSLVGLTTIFWCRIRNIARFSAQKD
jgi:hemerythrin